MTRAIPPAWGRFLSLVVLLVLAAGCAYGGEEPAYNGAWYGTMSLRDPYVTVREARLDPDDFSVWGPAAKEIPVEIVGNPFGTTPEAFEAFVLERMQPARWKQNALRPNLRFVPMAPQAGVRVVAAFDYEAGLGPQAFCSERPIPPQVADSETLRLRFVLCRGEEVLSAARTKIWRQGADADYRLHRKISDLTLALFPYRDLRPGIVLTRSGAALGSLHGGGGR